MPFLHPSFRELLRSSPWGVECGRPISTSHAREGGNVRECTCEKGRGEGKESPQGPPRIHRS